MPFIFERFKGDEMEVVIGKDGVIQKRIVSQQALGMLQRQEPDANLNEVLENAGDGKVAYEIDPYVPKQRRVIHENSGDVMQQEAQEYQKKLNGGR
jgi:hypothetical protein